MVQLIDNYFSSTVRLTMMLLYGALIYFFYNSPVILVLGLVVLMAVLTAKYELVVDVARKEAIDAFKILWIPFSVTTVEYEEIECISTSRERQEYSANSRSRTRQVKYFEYVAELVFDGDVRLEILRKTDVDEFQLEVGRLSQQLNVRIEQS